MFEKEVVCNGETAVEGTDLYRAIIAESECARLSGELQTLRAWDNQLQKMLAVIAARQGGRIAIRTEDIRLLAGINGIDIQAGDDEIILTCTSTAIQ